MQKCAWLTPFFKNSLDKIANGEYNQINRCDRKKSGKFSISDQGAVRALGECRIIWSVKGKPKRRGAVGKTEGRSVIKG